MRKNRLIVAVGQSLLWTLARIQNKPSASPAWWKRHTLISLAHKHKLQGFLETGTYLGDTSNFMARRGLKVVTIEVDAQLAAQARNRFQDNIGVTVLEGDSAIVIEQAWPQIDKPALLWLDGHFSGGITSAGELESPLMRELKFLFSQTDLTNSVIVIDDVQDLHGQNGYVDVASLNHIAQSNNYDMKTSGSIAILSPRD